MKLLVISSAPFIYKDCKAYAYGPYVQEMEIWAKNCKSISFCCPTWSHEDRLLVRPVSFRICKQYQMIDFDISTIFKFFSAFFISAINLLILIRAMIAADHIHLRCPGNIGLLGCFAQIFFPSKPKTAKYAGNWDPKAKQPFTYKLQKWILSNRFLTKNMKVLVYGEWPGNNKNLQPFFTASYSDADITTVEKTELSKGVHFVFAGMLVKGKNPLYAIQLVEKLHNLGYNVTLSLYGDGMLHSDLSNYISRQKIQNFVFLKGNQSSTVLKKAYQDSHFVILPSDSEGWPKVVAEGMFWGAIPIVTPVSCVPFMLDFGNRGILLHSELNTDVSEIEKLISDQSSFNNVSKAASFWSQPFTTDKFELEIKQLLL